VSIGKADGVRILEGNIPKGEKKKKKRRVVRNFPGVKEPGMLTNDDTVTRETLPLLRRRSTI